MRPNEDQKLEILKLEMGLIQGTFDKYDDLMWRNRNWFITIWAGAIGLGITTNQSALALLAMAAAFLYWIIEGTMRFQYWFKYVVRYRAIRTWLNESADQDISVYDLTNHYGERPTTFVKFIKSYLKLEPTLVFGSMLLGAGLVYWGLTQELLSAVAI